MSSRYNFDKGSSRSNRADSRTHRVRHWEESDHERHRSRSPRQRLSPTRSKHSEERSSKSRERDFNQKKKDDRASPSNWSDDEVPAPPPPPRITKISIGFSKPKAPIKMNISGPAKQAKVTPKASVASIFNEDDDDDDEPEEMPAEARMRMRNIGRETPTSAGPNSFGKTKQGFCDAKKVFEKNLKEALETDASKKSTSGKFPQTIYKLKGP